MKVVVERAGYLTSVQDLGRAGHRASGISPGGALDTHALRVANLLVGNDPAAAGLEVALGGLRLRFGDERMIAWCGGEFEVEAHGARVVAGHVALLDAGDELLVRPTSRAARAWLAISGGIDVPLVLGSRSTDLRSRFGGVEGRALCDGDTLDLMPCNARASRIAKLLAGIPVSTWSAPAAWSRTRPAHPYLRFVRGGDSSRFSESALTAFTTESFTVLPDSDRMGVRLTGPGLERCSDDDLLSEAVTPGTVQIPLNGSPILLLGDCQTIGGYPKIAHVISVDLPAVAQLVSGDVVRFAEVSLRDAQFLLWQRDRDFAWFRAGLKLKTA